MKKIATTILSTLTIMGGAIAFQSVHPVTAMASTTTKSETVNHSTSIEKINTTTDTSDIEVICKQIAQDDTLTKAAGEELRDKLVAKFTAILPTDNISLRPWIEFGENRLLKLAATYNNGWVGHDALYWAIEDIQNKAMEYFTEIENIDVTTDMASIENLCTRISQDETLTYALGERLRDKLVAKFITILPIDDASLQPWIEFGEKRLLKLAATYNNGWVGHDALYWAIEDIQVKAMKYFIKIENIDVTTDMASIEDLCTRISQDETLTYALGERLRDKLVAKFTTILPIDNASLQPWIEFGKKRLSELAAKYTNGWVGFDALYWAIEDIQKLQQK